MTDLDKKLREILEDFHDGGEFHDWTDLEEERYVARLKQAFEEAGYGKLFFSTVPDHKLMTGAQWYERWVKELPTETKVISMNTVKKAAKRASGVKE